MLCTLAFRDHMALKHDIPASAILIPAQGKPTTTERTDAVQYPSLPPLKKAQILCWLAFRDHTVLKSDAPTIEILIPAEGTPATTERTHAVIHPPMDPQSKPRWFVG